MQIESWVVVPSCLAGESQAITTSRRAARVTFLIGMCETMAPLRGRSRRGFIRNTLIVRRNRLKAAGRL